MNRRIAGYGAFCWIAAILLLALLLSAGCEGKSSTAPYGPENIKLTAADMDSLVAAARSCLTDANCRPGGLSDTLTKPYHKDVFVAVFRPQQDFLIGRGREDNVLASLQAACAELRGNTGFQKKFAGHLPQTRIHINIIAEVTELTKKSADKMRYAVEPGIHGLIMDYNGKRVFQLGEEVIWRGWGMKGFNDKQRVMGRQMAELRLQKISKAAGANDKNAWKEAQVYYFSTHAMVEQEPGGKASPTYRAMILYPQEITRRQVLEAAWLAADHLRRHTNEEGLLGYHYMPTGDQFADMKHYNIVRHAGSVWGLFTAYKATGDKALLEAGRRALDYLGKSIKTAADNPNIGYLDYNGQSLLGTNALAAMSLCEIPQELLTPEWKQIRERLGNSLIAFQVEDGRFYYSWKQVQAGGPVPDPQPMYFPGEAFLALMKLMEVDPQERWLAAANKCAQWQMDDYDKDPSKQPDAWVVQALCKLYRHTKQERLATTVFRMVEWHFRHQWGMPEKSNKLPYEDYLGGADNSAPPRSTPTSARNEANAEAWHLARLVGNKQMEEKLARSVMAAIWHNIVDQFRPLNSYWVSKPDQVLGGLRGSLIANDIRIDYNQHFLSAAINALDLAESLYGEGGFGPLSAGRILDVYKLGITPDQAAQQLAAALAPAPAP